MTNREQPKSTLNDAFNRNTSAVISQDVQRLGEESKVVPQNQHQLVKKGKFLKKPFKWPRKVPKYLKEFCKESTLHGIRYFTERDRHWFERTWWMTAFVVSTSLCAIMIQNIWSAWNENPALIILESRTTPTSAIPFPAMTVCSPKRINKQVVDYTSYKHVKNIVKTGELNVTAFMELSPKGVSLFDTLSHLCHWDFRMPPKSNLVLERSDPIHFHMRDIAPPFEIMMTAGIVPMRLSFEYIVNDQGRCFTYNALNSKDIFTKEVGAYVNMIRSNPSGKFWNIEDGYDTTQIERLLYPFRVVATGGNGWYDTYRFRFATNFTDAYEYCDTASKGFRIALHRPDEFPTQNRDFITLPPRQEVVIKIKPNVVTTSEGLRSYSPHARGCLFKYERTLKLFQSYSQSNCEIECHALFSKKTCGCSLFSEAREQYTETCTIFQKSCIDKMNYDFIINSHLKNCDCLPDCTSITYELETANDPQKFKTKNQTELNQIENEVAISFKKTHFIGMKRTETTMWSDFVASCGGLLGLFMGASLLSLIEVIYFFTLRLWFKKRQEKLTQYKNNTISLNNKRKY